MNCCQCQGIEQIYGEEYVSKELRAYRKKGPSPTTRWLAQAIEAQGVQDSSLLDIGGGRGIKHLLLAAGASRAIDVDASAAYLSAAMNENKRRGFGNRVSYYHGDFVTLAPDIPPADIVTLDRVICCYHDMVNLVKLSTQRAQRLYGLIFPRDTWWIKLGIAAEDLIMRVRRIPFRGYAHSTARVEELLQRQGLQQVFYRRSLIWHVALYRRTGEPAFSS